MTPSLGPWSPMTSRATMNLPQSDSPPSARICLSDDESDILHDV